MTALRRFYKTAIAQETEGGFEVLLDERRLRTPGNALALLPTRVLAEAVAAEWAAQGELIDVASMPLTKLSFAAIDRTEDRRDDLVAEIGKYAETDLVCHRAEAPEALTRRQAARWNPWLDWAKAHYGFAPEIVAGVVAGQPDREGIDALMRAAQGLDRFRLAALAQAVGLTGSAVLGFALLHARIGSEEAFEAAALDDLFALEAWGEDAEARARLDRQAKELGDLARFVAALG